ncbi:MAG: hypothetical protein ACLTLQ_06385 [[Clostridium] scindens]
MLRDYETISAALTAAETGHLVLSTLRHNRRGADHRPCHRRLPGRKPEPDQDRALQRDQRRYHPMPHAYGRRARQDSRNGDSDGDGRGVQPDPGEQKPPDGQRHAVGQRAWNAYA